MDITDREERADYYRNIRNTNRRDRNRYECPTCHTPGALSAHEKSSGYQCSACTRAEEGPSYDANECYSPDY